LRPEKAYGGIDVAVAKNRRLPIAVCVWRDGRLEPLPLTAPDAPLPPALPGNLPILDAGVRADLATQTADYLRQVQQHFSVTIERLAIDAPREPRPSGTASRECEAALGRAGISYIHTPDMAMFDRIPVEVAAHLQNPTERKGLPHANCIWMLFGFDLFRVLSMEGWPCIEVYPQATVRALGVGERHKKKPGAVLEQLTAAARHTGWPSPPSLDRLRGIAFGNRHDCLDAYLSAWVASLPDEACERLGSSAADVIFRPRLAPVHVDERTPPVQRSR
jgi:predicted nuclease with RNAse H fold